MQLDPLTGSAMQEYSIHVISSPEATELADLESLANDLKLVMSFIERLRTLENDAVLAQALFSAGLVTYRRCFTSGVRNGLTKKDVESLPNEGALEFHNYLVAQANKLIAHSVNPFEQTNVGVMVAEEKVGGVVTLNTALVGLDHEGIIQWGSLVRKIGNDILSPRIAEAHKRVESVANAMPLEDIKKGHILGHSVPGPNAANTRRD
jgi:hypothetical protein